jgi:hypothetical protein
MPSAAPRASAVINAVSGALFRRVPNPTLTWTGVSSPGLDRRLLLRVGDCSWQQIPYGHTWGRPGYPAFVAEALVSRGIALSFANYHAGLVRDVPDRDRLAAVCRGHPDAIIVQLGAYYASRALIPGEAIRPYELRTWFNSVTGPAGGSLHRTISRPLLRHRGRYRTPPASDVDAGAELSAFLLRLRADHDGVPIGFIPPHMTSIDGAMNPDRLRKTADLLVDAAHAASTCVIDVRGDLARAGLSPSRLFGANGYDLRQPGHEIVGRRVVDWLLAEWFDTKPAYA